jgi:GxxExxY protein
MVSKKLLDELTYEIIGCAIEVHKALGPGLLESIYEKCLINELMSKDLRVVSQLKVPINYKGLQLDADLRLDILVENLIVVEVKAVEKMNTLYEAQVLSYMRLLEKPKGILINFCCKNIFKEGQRTFVNDLYSLLPSV